VLKQMKLLASLFLIACGFYFASCTRTSLDSKVPDLLQADPIQITTSGAGLALVTERDYSLQRNDKVFRGKAQFSVKGSSSLQRRQAIEDIEIPLDAAQSFLKTLASLPLKEGEYKPTITITDDYPSIRIKLSIKGETVVIFTESQGKDHIPWGVTFKGKTFVAASDIPARALNELEPYLKGDVLQKLIEQK
jgi:hypothetical protein